MAVLPDWTSLGPLPSVRPGPIAPSAPNVAGRSAQALGRGLRELGQGLDRIAASQRERQSQQGAFDTETAFQKFKWQEILALDEAIQSMEPGQAANFSVEWEKGYDERAREFLSGVPEKYKPKIDQDLFSTKRSLYAPAKDFERGEQKRVSIVGIGETVQSSIIPRTQKAGVSESDIGHVHALAQRIGANSSDLLKVFGYETMGSFNPSQRGGMNKDGTGAGSFMGLIQFSPDNQKRYGIVPGMTFEEQLPAVGQYLIDNGWKPGMSLGHMYSIILTGGLTKDGQPRWDRGDVNGTVREHVARMEKSGYGTLAGFSLAKLQADVDRVVDAAPGLNPIEKDVERRKQYHDTAIGYLDNLPPGDVVDVLSLPRDELPEMFRTLSDEEIRTRLDTGRTEALAQSNKEIASLTSLVTPDNFENTAEAIESILRKQNDYRPPESRLSDEQISLQIKTYRNSAAKAIVDRQLENDPENFIPFIEDNPFLTRYLTANQIEKYRQQAVKSTKDRKQRQQDERDIDLAKLNPALSAAARGDVEYLGNDGEIHDTEDRLEIDEINLLINKAEAGGEPPYVLKYLRELKETVQTRGGRTIADNLDQGVYSSIEAKMYKLGIGRKSSKGVRETVVKETAPVSEIVELQTEILAAENRGQIKKSDSITMLQKVIPAYLAQVEREVGRDNWFGIGGGPEDVYDVGFEKIHQLLENNGLEDDINLKAAMFTAFLDYAGRLMPADISPENAPDMQLKFAKRVEDAFVDYLTGGKTYEGSPTQVILPDGRTLDLGNFGAKQPHSISIGSGAIETRKFRDAKGSTHIGQFLKGTGILLGSRNLVLEALQERVPRNRKSDRVLPKSEKSVFDE